ncbi:hypothetical protein Pst134EA_015336 [Puccinia striiformis f. sp. tritici]|nr:hypothetical protein Pst134EA_015336 [Puccinia striiformis f. sp. tritici]KAH9463252.1 hypothetical protein Pst134EA_015336 [Puccinia striiformis f. sp. tritici]KAI9604569.1 hypothetical protein KEM48_002460 [Puccinia striiformis f. sp. tritici PST-130]
MPRSSQPATRATRHSNHNVASGPELPGDDTMRPITRSSPNAAPGFASSGGSVICPISAPVQHRTPKRPTIKMSTPELRRSRRIFDLSHGDGRFVIPTEHISLKEVNKNNIKHSAKSAKHVAKKNSRRN